MASLVQSATRQHNIDPVLGHLLLMAQRRGMGMMLPGSAMPKTVMRDVTHRAQHHTTTTFSPTRCKINMVVYYSIN